MRVGFYNAFVKKENDLTDLSILKLLDYISTLDSKNRTVRLSDDCYYSMPQFMDLGDNRRAFWIGKFLKDKPYNGKIGTDDVSEILGDAYQPVVCMFDATNRMLVIENTMIGPKKAKIEEFFNSFICHLDDGNKSKYQLKLIRQKSNKTIDLIDNQTDILGVSLKIKVDDYNSDSFQKIKNGQNMLIALTDKNVAFGKKFQANIITIELKKGRFKNDLKNTIIDLVRTINAEDASLITATVDVKFPDGSKDTIDLKGNRYMSFTKNTGDLTGFGVLSNVLNDCYTNHEFPNDSYHYLINHFAQKYKTCPNEQVNYRKIPYGGYKEYEKRVS